MKALVVHAPQHYAVEEIPVPPCPPAGMLVKVNACALCGSDLRTLRSGHYRVTLPWTIGHEICASVVERGPRCTGPWAVGEMLAIGPLAYCGVCEFCASGRFELCTGSREIAQAWPGGFADFLAVPEECVERGSIHRVPPWMDPVFAAISEPLSSCINAQEKGGVGQGDTVVIIGGGPVGCIHAALARSRGAERVILADRKAERLAFARAFDPDLLIDAAKEDLVGAVMRFTGGAGAQVVISAAPSPQAVIQSVEIARKGGRVLLFGGLATEDSKPGVDMNLVHYNALTLIGTTTFAPRHQAEALRLLASGAFPAAPLVSHRFPLSRFVEGARLAIEGHALKCVFLPEEAA
ncbi:MAG: alcohol dehydrogenase catalytic domain-containing protein [Spirochaetia bacterium]